MTRMNYILLFENVNLIIYKLLKKKQCTFSYDYYIKHFYLCEHEAGPCVIKKINFVV